jgi:hypothetical protein
MANAGIQQLVVRAPQLNFDPRPVIESWNQGNVSIIATNDDLCEQSGACGRIAVTNRQDRTIRLNRALWLRLGGDGRRKSAIALHEVLVLSNIETTGLYFLSAQVYGISESEIQNGRLAIYADSPAKLFINLSPIPGADCRRFDRRRHPGRCQTTSEIDARNSLTITTDPGNRTISLSNYRPYDVTGVVLRCRDDSATDCRFFERHGGGGCSFTTEVKGSLDAAGTLTIVEEYCSYCHDRDCSINTFTFFNRQTSRGE